MSKPVYVNTEYRAHLGPHDQQGREAYCLTKWGVDKSTGRWSHIKDCGIRSADFSEKEIHGVPVVRL